MSAGLSVDCMGYSCTLGMHVYMHVPVYGYGGQLIHYNNLHF